MNDMSDTLRAYFLKYGSRIYDLEANQVALEEKRKAEEKREEMRRLYPPSRGRNY